MRKRLKQKGIQLGATCPLCHTREEFQDHIFMQCKEIQRLWFISPLDFHVPPILNLSDWLLQWVFSPDSTVSQFRLIWKIRNDVFNEDYFNALNIFQEVSVSAEDVNQACNFWPCTRRTPYQLCVITTK